MYLRAVHGAVHLEWGRGWEASCADGIALAYFTSFGVVPGRSIGRCSKPVSTPAGAFVVLIQTAGNQVFLGDTSPCLL